MDTQSDANDLQGSSPVGSAPLFPLEIDDEVELYDTCMTDKASGRTRTRRITRSEKPNGMVEVHLGSSSAKVYPVRNKNRIVFQVAWHVGGRRY